MSLKRAWQFLAAWWMDGETDSGIPAVGAGGVYVPQLNTTTREVTWAAQIGEILVDDASGEFLYDDATGDILYDG